MLFVLPTLLALAPPAGFTASVERLPVKIVNASNASVHVDTMLGRLVLTGVTVTGKTRLCPTSSKAGATTVLECKTKKISATLERDAHGAYVDVRELTTFNWTDRDAEIPMAMWSLRELSIPDTCPGNGWAARAECAFDDGDLGAAKLAWDEALNGPDVGLARLRLGDLALRSGDVETAMKLYASVSTAGPVGRLAAARSCELIGTCFKESESDKVANDEGLALPFARELGLFTIRREVISGRETKALTLLLSRLEKDEQFCEGAIAFCQKVVAAGLESNDVEARIAALSAFLNEALRHGPRELELSVAAARTAQELGAPGFAAAMLAANTPRVSKSELPSHLLQVVQLYVAAGDRIRAGVVLEYAESRLAGSTKTKEWNRVRQQLGRAARSVQSQPVTRNEEAFQALTSQVSLTTDLARAAAARSRAVEAPQEAP
ncbi:MAG: hypothetical protein QM817_14705 [Archangium sp.]